jgi:hypothetical protein
MDDDANAAATVDTGENKNDAPAAAAARPVMFAPAKGAAPVAASAAAFAAAAVAVDATVDGAVGLCTLNQVDPYPIAYNLSNP